MMTLDRPPGLAGFSDSIPQNRIAEATQWMEKEEGIPAPIRMGFYASMWFAHVASFTDTEEQTLADGTFDQHRDSHRLVLNKLAVDGQMVLIGVKQHGLPSSVGFTLDDIAATLEMLRENDRCNYGPHNHPSVNKTISVIFNAQRED